MKIYHYKIAIVFTLVSFVCLISCKSFIEVDPPSTSVNEGNVYEFDGTAIAAVIGIYADMSTNNFAADLTFYPELSADNLRMLNLSAASTIGYYTNNLLANDGSSISSPWIIIYPRIFTCNAVIERLSKSTSVTPVIKQRLLGQVYFLRAFFYFYLTNLYGDVPLALNTDYTINNRLTKAASGKVYDQIIVDLKQAQTLLPEGYLTGNMTTTFTSGLEQRTAPNRYTASALLARVYLYLKDYVNAEAMAMEVINQNQLYTATLPLNQIFQKNNKETIWALQSVNDGANTGEAEYFILRDGEPSEIASHSTFLTPSFINSFQTGDQRKSAWISTITTGGVVYSYPAKYKAISYDPLTEQSILLRLGEQYLIRAEARIQQNKIDDGVKDLNVLRDRAIDKSESNENLRLKLLTSSLSKEEALAALNYERRVELFAECAHRWLDLKRTGQIDAVMAPATAQKGGSWSSYKSLYPVPAVEITNNNNLVQNPGYTN